MKRTSLKIIALCLALCLMLSGCFGISLEEYLSDLLRGAFTVPFSEMEYQRPDPDAFLSLADSCLEKSKTETDVEALMEEVWAVWDSYNLFYTNYALANIHYSMDLTDIYWEEEYNYCMDSSAEVDAAIDQLLYALAACPLREELEQEDYFGEGYFDDYEGESLWDETFTSLMDQEAQLITQYYALSAQSADYDYYSEEFFTNVGDNMADLFLELVKVRQEIATCAGYDSYPAFAYDFYYARDYTPDQAVTYLSDIQQELSDLYRDLPSDVWDAYYKSSTEEETFAYVEELAGAMGGTVYDAFELMRDAELYDISYSENKYNASFEIFLSSYAEPFIFVSPSLNANDKLTFAHEFGHFCNDYASGGRVAGIDVAEIFSQSMEYLSLEYCQDTESLTRMKMADSLCVFVEQSFYASFEHQVYSLEGANLTKENIRALYEQLGNGFGFDSWYWDSRDYVMIPHFFTNPMYVISYVVSNDAAMQIYQKELASQGAGLKLLEENFATEERDFLAFVRSAGLESPFDVGRVRAIRETLEDILF